MKRTKRTVWMFLVLILIGIGIWNWWNTQFTALNKDIAYRTFVVTKGQSLSDVAVKLEAQKFIRADWAFTQRAKKYGLENSLQAGSYKLSASMSVGEIIQTLQQPAGDLWITLLEGWRIEEMAEKLQRDLGIDQNKFLEFAVEGYMFPDTYLFPKEIIAKQVVNTLKKTFETKFTQDIRAGIRAQGLTEEEGIILASIVEREARSDEVRKMVAGILLKRLKIGMGLNADATIQYILGYQPKEKSWWKRSLTYDDLKVASPYNTYIHAGLPPTPIANPSLSSLRAVANADASTPYLYYYHDLQGRSHYAKTLEEHNANVAKYD